ncbi:Ubiquinone/menaquinone biosynthesis C-methylase UbiE [Anaerovirgula multivorans]|uniref:Ubiquinone/menaquinone biosynthesis C-methylase UbiE n=1 Tax=Anaerovirgula multivorans TaxID=312168 RepID=A0A239AVD6_9FIRM|nr:class I SAM-dependent methyltransferase [Anaerovirgula multivorans]SNR98994.1 Ubiquinone/menaquinone biosynthesis C-methylase UbiE [Anaerovirgula multivorans]
MGFYEELSKYYDIVFPTGEAQLKFIEKRTTDTTNNILDIACGTGNYSISIAEKGFQVTSFDLDEGMVSEVKKKAKDKELQLAAFVGDMKILGKYFQEESFHIAFCIGNSLVHLTKLEEIQEALNQMYKVIKRGGHLILQIINYDRIIKYSIDGLPTIEDKEQGVKFIRKYLYEEEKRLIHFNTELIVTQGDRVESYTNSVPLYPLQSQQLIGMLQNAGFTKIQLYGSFMEEAYKEESYAAIVAAEK